MDDDSKFLRQCDPEGPEVQPTEVEVRDTKDYVFYFIKKGSYILRAETDWITSKGGDQREQYMASLRRRPAYTTSPVRMKRTPSRIRDHGYGVAYFGFQDSVGDDSEVPAGETIPPAEQDQVERLSRGYGHVVSFQVTQDLTLLAIDHEKSRKWLMDKMVEKNHRHLVPLVRDHFTPNSWAGRESDADNDATVAKFICDKTVFDGYGIAQGFKPFHPELALCLRRVKSKAVCLASIHHDSSAKRAKDVRARLERRAAAAAARKRGRPLEGGGRALFHSSPPPEAGDSDSDEEPEVPFLRRLGLPDMATSASAAYEDSDNDASPSKKSRTSLGGSPGSSHHERRPVFPHPMSPAAAPRTGPPQSPASPSTRGISRKLF
jgi:hypothetical protein